MNKDKRDIEKELQDKQDKIVQALLEGKDVMIKSTPKGVKATALEANTL